MNAEHMTDSELIEALELAAPRIRLCGVEEFRRVADTVAELAVEASRRLRDVLEITGPRTAAAGLEGKVRNVRIHADGRITAELEIRSGGEEFLRQVKGARYAG